MKKTKVVEGLIIAGMIITYFIILATTIYLGFKLVTHDLMDSETELQFNSSETAETSNITKGSLSSTLKITSNTRWSIDCDSLLAAYDQNLSYTRFWGGSYFYFSFKCAEWSQTGIPSDINKTLDQISACVTLNETKYGRCYE